MTGEVLSHYHVFTHAALRTFTPSDRIMTHIRLKAIGHHFLDPLAPGIYGGSL